MADRIIAFLAEAVPALFWATAEFTLLVLAFSACLRAYALFRSRRERTADFIGHDALARWIRLTWDAWLQLAVVAILLGAVWAMIAALTEE
ncbi:hypothetical protein HLB44_02065 [Aquincola sp. S2]|uniref:Mechanosensitive ion channel protein MscS n=1 Tax=Pseudaquabacterium terrae TaxID=2732868 RepID=A0ABX2EB40_9BURK|nr:hypothetical protein [Aquabacterium terrae]NRF65763.1 hypothetical protein [Aquabacterium terrae]